MATATIIKFCEGRRETIAVLVKAVGDSILINYPTHKPYSQRDSRWVYANRIKIEWMWPTEDPTAPAS